MPEDFYTAFFRHMKVCVEDAAKAVGLFDVELVDEPTVAAMSFVGKKEIKNGQNVLVYDFG